MNDERDRQSIDELVSATYREHSDERAPEYLNRKVLAMAADGAKRTGNVRPLSGSWTRPLALAATIALSLAIVLEVTRLPDEIASPATPSASADSTLRKEFTPKDSRVVDAAREQARLRDGSNRDDGLTAKPQSSLKLEKRQDTAVADTPKGCDEKARARAATWLACIEALRQSGAVSLAEQEYEEYIQKFPVE